MSSPTPSALSAFHPPYVSTFPMPDALTRNFIEIVLDGLDHEVIAHHFVAFVCLAANRPYFLTSDAIGLFIKPGKLSLTQFRNGPS
jgi:hypothetical protein